MKPELEHIMTFVKVVETGTFTAAADALNISKSVVSKHVTALEKALGGELFKRTTRKLIITEIGQAFYQHAKEIPEKIIAAQQAVQPFHDQPKGNLKVYAPSNFNISLKNTPVMQFLIENPEIKLQLELVRPVEEYVEKEFDIIILWKINDTQFPSYNLIPKKLFSTPAYLYASKAYLKKHGEPKNPAELIQHNCFASIGNHWAFREKSGPLYYLNVSGNLDCKTDDMIHAAVTSDLGIAYAYPLLFQNELAEHTVVPILCEYTQIEIEVYAFYHPTSYVPLKIRALIDFLQATYQNMQDEILRRGKLDGV